MVRPTVQKDTTPKVGSMDVCFSLTTDEPSASLLTQCSLELCAFRSRGGTDWSIAAGASGSTRAQVPIAEHVRREGQRRGWRNS